MDILHVAKCHKSKYKRSRQAREEPACSFEFITAGYTRYRAQFKCPQNADAFDPCIKCGSMIEAHSVLVCFRDDIL
jgi:hypothetical protein